MPPPTGEAKNSWLTGTAAWNFVAISQWILGIRPDHGGLRVDPVLPAAWEGFSAVRVFRGATYRIKGEQGRRRGEGGGEAGRVGYLWWTANGSTATSCPWPGRGPRSKWRRASAAGRR